MPFYLVTHTALVEADDETAAAQKVVESIQAGGRFKMTVRFDEDTVAHVEVEAGLNDSAANPALEAEAPQVCPDGQSQSSPEQDFLREDEKSSFFKRVVSAITLLRE